MNDEAVSRAIPGFEIVDDKGRLLIPDPTSIRKARRPKLTFDINEGTRAAFKRKCAREGTTMTDVMGELCRLYVLGKIPLDES